MTNAGKVQSYIQERIDQYYTWYDSKAVRSKTSYQRGRLLSAISAVLIPVISNVNLSFFIRGSEIDFSNILVSALGITVALMVALEGVYHHREQWLNSRSTAEYLRTQKLLFEHKAEDYETLDEAKAFTQLVNRIEKAIAEENAVTLNVLTRSDQKGDKTS
jgi:flavodoxin